MRLLKNKRLKRIARLGSKAGLMAFKKEILGAACLASMRAYR
jgi:hypothetical protein